MPLPTNAAHQCPPARCSDVDELRIGGEGDLVFYAMARPPGAKSAPGSADDLAAGEEEAEG